MLLERDDSGGVVAVPDAEADVSVVAEVAGGSQSDGVGFDQRVTAEVLDELRSLRSRTVRTEAKAVGQLTVAFEAAHHILLSSTDCTAAWLVSPRAKYAWLRADSEMKLRQPIRHLLRHGKPAERAPALTQDEKARQTEQSIQAGLAANKFPPR